MSEVTSLIQEATQAEAGRVNRRRKSRRLGRRAVIWGLAIGGATGAVMGLTDLIYIPPIVEATTTNKTKVEDIKVIDYTADVNEFCVAGIYTDVQASSSIETDAVLIGPLPNQNFGRKVTSVSAVETKICADQSQMKLAYHPDTKLLEVRYDAEGSLYTVNSIDFTRNPAPMSDESPYFKEEKWGYEGPMDALADLIDETGDTVGIEHVPLFSPRGTSSDNTTHYLYENTQMAAAAGAGICTENLYRENEGMREDVRDELAEEALRYVIGVKGKKVKTTSVYLSGESKINPDRPDLDIPDKNDYLLPESSSTKIDMGWKGTVTFRFDTDVNPELINCGEGDLPPEHEMGDFS